MGQQGLAPPVGGPIGGDSIGTRKPDRQVGVVADLSEDHQGIKTRGAAGSVGVSGVPEYSAGAVVRGAGQR